MPITDWPAAERPREKLLSQGAGALSDAELLAIFLRTGVPGCSAVDLRALLQAEQKQFCSRPGLGPAKYAQLQAVMEMARRHLFEELKRGDALTSPGAVRNFLRSQLAALPHEVFACLYLDNQHRVIAFEELFRGTLDSASVYPREVIKRALAHNAAALILTHNHPSGVSEPSQADLLLTRRLKESLALVDIRVLDHLVVGDGEPVSFAERGLL